MADKNREERIKRSEIWGYGLGSFSGQLANRTVSSYMILYLTNCLLLDPLMAGSIFLIGRLIDAVSDIVMANIADRTRTKYGSYRPYILFCLVPLGLTFFGCFFTPGILSSSSQKLAWAAVFYILETSVFLTATGTSYGALATVMTRDPIERTKLASARSMGETLAVLVINASFMSLVVAFGGVSEAKGWAVAAGLLAFLIAGGYAICGKTVKERHAVNETTNKPVPLRTRLGVLRGNTPLLFLGLSAFFMMLGAVFVGTAFSYYCIYNLGRADLVAPLAVANALAGIVAAMLMPYIAKKIAKRNILLLGAAICGVSVLAVGLHDGLLGAAVYTILLGFGNTLVMAAIWSLVPDAADFGAARSGVAAPGLVYSIITFIIKAVGGLSSYFVGFILSVVGFDAAAASQPGSVLQALRVSIIVVLVVSSLLCIGFSFGCRKLDQNREKAA